jgi:hypothetical protein
MALILTALQTVLLGLKIHEQVVGSRVSRDLNEDSF